MLDGIGAELKTNRRVSVGQIHHQLKEIAITHHHKLCATAINVASLFYEA